MKEVWKEILQGVGTNTLLALLLILILIVTLTCYVSWCYSRSSDQKPHQNTNISHPIKNPIQTNFTS